MSLTPFGRGRDSDMPVQSSPAAAPSVAGGLTAFIDQGSEFEGKLSFRDTVRIDGRFRGEISSENTLIVGETGEIEATIRSNTVAISGTVNGDVHAAHKLVLHKTARIEGTIEAPSVVIEEGAVFNGQMKMPGGKSSSGALKAIDGGSSPKAAAPKSEPAKDK